MIASLADQGKVAVRDRRPKPRMLPALCHREGSRFGSIAGPRKQMDVFDLLLKAAGVVVVASGGAAAVILGPFRYLADK